jgi:predicted Zn-dependent protease
LSLLACIYLSACQILPSAENLAATVDPSEENNLRVSFDAMRARDPQSKIGAKGHPQVLKANGGAYQSQKLDELLAIIVGRLVTHSSDPDRAYDITVLDSPSVNAFALPGGYLYVTRGLLSLANDASEVAAVLAHEMAHVSSNHGVLRRQETKVVDMAERVTSEVVTNPVVAKVAKASTEKRLATFSKKQELQADAVGIKLVGEAGYDPFAAARFLESMDRYAAWSSALNSGGSDMSNSHPSTPRRIELARRHARLIGPAGTGERNQQRYFSGIDGLIFGDEGKGGVIRGQRFSHAKLGVTFTVPEPFELNNRDDAVLAAGPNESALRFDAEAKGFGISNPVSYLKSGWVNGLLPNTVKALTINGISAASAQAIAGDWRFIVTVVEYQRRYFRFILAAPRTSTDIDRASQEIFSSFRQMTDADMAALTPLRIKIVRVNPGDTVTRLARRMKGVSRKPGLFRSLNGLGTRQRPAVGSQVKLVVD